MLLKKLFVGGRTEQQVVDSIKEHMKILYSAASAFREAIENDNKDLMLSVSGMEKEGDIIKRKIISDIYEGAFLPYIRPNICRFVEIVDNALDQVELASIQYEDAQLEEGIKGECIRISDINLKMSEMLLVCFGSLLAGEDLRVKNLVLRIYEKKVNEIGLALFRGLKHKEISNFWDGLLLARFLSTISQISDIIESATERLQIINVSAR